MDILALSNKIQLKSGEPFLPVWVTDGFLFILESIKQNYITYSVVLTALAIIATYLARKWHLRALLRERLRLESAGKPRFRKRDKALFYGRKMLRKVKYLSGQVRNSGQGRKRRLVMKFARELLRLRKDILPVQLKRLEPPAEYLEEARISDDRYVPSDALYMLQSIRVFGHFEEPVFITLCKHTEILNLDAGSFLFKIGDADENIYIVQSGKINVFVTGADGSLLTLKMVKAGESIMSLLSFLDVLYGHTHPYKTVSAKVIEDTVVVRLPMIAFKEVFDKYPDIFVKVVQHIMVRLQRVIFTALHQYLGLSSELMSSQQRNKHKSTHVGSPTRRNREKDEMQSSGDYQESLNDNFQAPNSFPTHRRSKSSIEMSYNRFSTPDMVLDIDQQMVNPCLKKRNSTISNDFSGDENLEESCVKGFLRELKLDDDTELRGKIEIREVSCGTYLMKEDSNKAEDSIGGKQDIALIYVVSGSLAVSQKLTDQEEEAHMFTAHTGDIVGALAVLTGEPSFFNIRAKHNCTIGLLSKSTFYNIMVVNPSVVLNVAHLEISRLSPFVRQVDFALDWVFLESGRALYRQDDESDSTYILLSGRLRSVITQDSEKKQLVAEYGKGDLVGIVEMVTQTHRSTTVMAVRDSELAKLPEGFFNVVKLRYPSVVTRLINLLGHRILGSWRKPSLKTMSSLSLPTVSMETRPAMLNFSTIAIVGVSDDVPLTAFTYELYHCLSAIGPTVRLTSEVIRKMLGSTAMDPSNEHRLISWLAQQEDQNKITLYQCDITVTMWTQRCIRQADCILIVGVGNNPPSIGKVEKEADLIAMRTQKELVLLHREGGEKPKNTVAWLNMRAFVTSHHHIQCPKRVFDRAAPYRIAELYNKVIMSDPNIHSDFSRLARWLTGTSVGLVLGGGGARGLAHVGMVKAILEAGVPIDTVGGVSIGAFMGALYCHEKDIAVVTRKAREFSFKMTQWWRQLLDLTYPITSMFSGKEFNRLIHNTFGDSNIEDLWLPYFTVSTDISQSTMRIHKHGSLWRYVRASMSLSGYMPPLCDPTDGHLLLDGGYINNLPGKWRKSLKKVSPKYVELNPADIMYSHGVQHVLAVDVGSVDDTDLTNYGDYLSGWWLLWKRINPFSNPVKVPDLPDIQSRLAYVSCVRQLEEVKNSDYCVYIRPPIEKYKTLQFKSFDEIREVGYKHGSFILNENLKSGRLPFNKDSQSFSAHSSSHYSGAYTFTDLAQMVLKVRRFSFDDSTSSESEDFETREVGYVSEPSVGTRDHDRGKHTKRKAGGSLSLSDNEIESDTDSEYPLRLHQKTL